MRGNDSNQSPLFSYVSLEDRIPQNHPLRPIRRMVNQALAGIEDSFGSMYSAVGRPSIAPEMLLRALLLQILYGIPSERQLMEQLDYNLLFRWFVGLGIDDTVWHSTTFTKNRDRLLDGDVATRFFAEIRELGAAKRLLSKEHFSVDGTLVEACASMKSLRSIEEQKDGDGDDDDDGDPRSGRNVEVNFRGERRSNRTHRSRTDPDARLMRKGRGHETKLCYWGHVLVENRNGLIVDTELTRADGAPERRAALEMLARVPGTHRVTLGADRGYDSAAFVETVRSMDATPHVACRKTTTLDGRTTRHEGYKTSQRRRKLAEEPFGWMKVVGLLRKLRHRGLEKVRWIFAFTAAAFNMVRIRNLLAPT